MKKYFIMGAAAALLTTSCSTDVVDNTEVDNTGKERIVLGAGDGQSVMTSRAGFSADTRIVARIVSDNRSGGSAKCVTTVLTAKKEQSGNGYSNVEYLDGNTRYWDDAYGRSSILSVYAVAIPNQKNDAAGTNMPSTLLKGATTWGTANASDNTLTWTLKTTQEYADLADQDLTYSNNIQETGKKGVWTYDFSAGKYPDIATGATNASEHTVTSGTDGRLYFCQQDKTVEAALTDAAGKFDKGQLEFKHALCRIQVNLVKGDGYASAPFSVTDMQLLGQSVSGTFDIKTAAWSNKGAATPITMAKWSSPAASKAATYEAQMLPGYVFASANNDNTLQLTVDGNTYYITNSQLRTALESKVPTGDYTTLMGNRYIFDITVAKAKITNITATIIDWNEVTADNTDVNNSHLTFSFYDNGTACTDINLYKYMQDLGSVYIDDSYKADKADPVAGSAYIEVDGLTPDGSTGKYKTSEFYQDNQTAYHFRSINNIAEDALNAGKTAFTMTSGEASTSNDYHWGAPMKGTLPSGKLSYKSNGYLDCIDKGIVAASTESTINLTEVHMMSQVVVKLTTPTTGAGVTLAGATVKITKLSKTGTVDMGSGKITPATPYNDLDAVSVTENAGVYSCTFNVVPQLLKRNGGASDDDYVGITIHTTDNNEYYIVKHLSEITATAVGTQVTNLQTKDDAITEWYPGHKYIYTFNISKTEIKNITATIVGWNEVVANNTNLDLEK